jgi:hypothetical protein
MDKLHITQDDYGFWMLSLEKDDGSLALLAHQFSTPDKAIHIANELIREHKLTATVLIDPPRPTPEASGDAPVPADYGKPAPKKAGA